MSPATSAPIAMTTSMIGFIAMTALKAAWAMVQIFVTEVMVRMTAEATPSA